MEHVQAPSPQLVRPNRAALGPLTAALVLGVAVATARVAGPTSGLALAVSTLSGGATATLQGLGEALPLGYAFAVGMAAAVNPCGFALLPTYLGLYLGTAAGQQRPRSTLLGRALLVSLAMTASFVALFGTFGLVLGLAGDAVGSLLPWLSVAVGVLLVLAGARRLSSERLDFRVPERLADALGEHARRSGVFGYAAYGLAFALSSLGCALPLFLTVVGSAIARGGLVAGLSELVLYALGMGALVAVLTLLAAGFGQHVLARARVAGRLLQPMGALLLLVTGGYIVYYWLSAGGIVG
jgi:cytochrome c biogenesis protein CcdA